LFFNVEREAWNLLVFKADLGNNIPMDPHLTNDLKEIESAVREFCSKEIEQEHLHDLEDRHTYPRELYGKIGELGIIGAGFSEDVGGSGYGAMGHVTAVSELCKNCMRPET
jgi:alkylation response protein AidB-like acyl-CoA dehydrogenase